MAEWVLAAWMYQIDGNVLGIRRVDEERLGQSVATIHIAIPLEYRRRQLAQGLGIPQIEDEQKTPRVNLLSSNGWQDPHSYIRVPADIVVSRLLERLSDELLESREINDQTIQVPRDAIDEIVRTARSNAEDENLKLSTTVRTAFAMRNVAIEPHQIRILTHKETREKWIKIADVDRGRRTSVRLATKQAGIQLTAASRSDDDSTEWSLTFAASEIRKLLTG